MNAEKTLRENGFKKIHKGKFIRDTESVLRKNDVWEYQINGEKRYSCTFFYDVVDRMVADNTLNKVIKSRKGLPKILELNGFIRNGKVFTKTIIVDNTNRRWWNLIINGVEKRYPYAKNIKKELKI